jgi:predicted transcriptional regulator
MFLNKRDSKMSEGILKELIRRWEDKLQYCTNPQLKKEYTDKLMKWRKTLYSIQKPVTRTKEGEQLLYLMDKFDIINKKIETTNAKRRELVKEIDSIKFEIKALQEQKAEQIELEHLMKNLKDGTPRTGFAEDELHVKEMDKDSEYGVVVKDGEVYRRFN